MTNSYELQLFDYDAHDWKSLGHRTSKGCALSSFETAIAGDTRTYRVADDLGTVVVERWAYDPNEGDCHELCIRVDVTRAHIDRIDKDSDRESAVALAINACLQDGWFFEDHGEVSTVNHADSLPCEVWLPLDMKDWHLAYWAGDAVDPRAIYVTLPIEAVDLWREQ